MRVDEHRLWGSLDAMGAVGALSEGGCCRLALSDLDGKGRDLFVGWCREAGCAVSWDAIGNIYARRAGVDADVPAVATGSHLDTQPHGGRYDGIYGVLAGLEVVRTLNDQRIRTRKPIDVIVWTNEEGVRFVPPLAGSSAFCGSLSPEQLQDARTTDGTTVREDLARIGYLGNEPPGSRRFDSFFEAHIEQGPVLERECLTIGVVTRVQGARVLQVDVRGEDGHAGTVPLAQRKDCVVAAAEMVTAIHRLGLDTDDQAKVTIGRFDVQPNSISTIPGRVIFTVDFRHPEAVVLDQLEDGIRERVRRVANMHGLEVDSARLIAKDPVFFDPEIVAIVDSCARELGYPARRMLSGAGHDAMNLAKLVPSGMIFVPCERGISHNEHERASPADLAAGANVLLHAMLRRAGIAGA
jgi:N-carbamoyl-L-amino-acid hydrolase